MMSRSSIKIHKLYQELRRAHGQPCRQWRLWCQRRKTPAEQEEVIIGAILTQRTNWRHVERVLQDLRQAGHLSLRAVDQFGRHRPRALARMIRPCGFPAAKVRSLLAVAGFFSAAGGLSRLRRRSLARLRRELLALPGIGPETADSMLLYAFGKAVFVVDEYTRRLAAARGLADAAASYADLQQLFTAALPRRVGLYQDFHALIVMEGQASRLTSSSHTV